MRKASILENQSKKLVALILMLLIIVTPISVYAYSENYNDYNNQYSNNNYYFNSKYNNQYGPSEDLGEAIVVNVIGYEPQIIKSSQIEASDVPIYVFLRGLTLGTFLGENAPETEPFISKPAIKYVKVFPDAISSKYIVGTQYKQPLPSELGLDNLGVVSVLLKQIKDETKVPEEITLNMTARIYFDFLRGFGDVSAVDMVLKEYGNEAKWKEDPNKNSFWNKKGYLRLIQAAENRARIQVYSSGPSPLGLLFEGGEDTASTQRFGDRGILEMSVGEVSTFTLPGSSAFFHDRVRIKLNEIADPQDQVLLKIISGGEVSYKELAKGMKISPSSNWGIENVDPKKGTVILRNAFGDRVQLDLKKDGKKVEEIREETLGRKEGSICSEGDIIKDDKIVDNDKTNAKKLYCTSIAEYKKAKTDNINLNDQVFEGIGKVYIGLADHLEGDFAQTSRALALFYLKKVSNLARVEILISNLEKELYGGGSSEPRYLEDEAALLTLIDIIPVGDDEKSSVSIKGIDKKIKEGEKIPGVTGKDKDTSWEWQVISIASTQVIIQKMITKEGKTTPGEKKNLPLQKETDIDDIKLIVDDIISKKRAYITVMPGGGDTYSESTFTIHIPIEKRLIQWTPEQIDKMIEETTKQIETLDKYIRQLDNIVKSWRYVCFATFAYLTIKNSFLAGAERNQARKDVMPIYTEKCEQESALRKTTFDKCMSEKAEEIEAKLDWAEGKQKEIDNCFKDSCYPKNNNFDKYYTNAFNENQDKFKKLNIQYSIDDDTFKELHKCQLYGEDAEFKELIQKKCDDLIKTANNQKEAFQNAYVLTESKFNELKSKPEDKDVQRIASIEFNTAYISSLDYKTNKPKEAEEKIIIDEVKKKLPAANNVKIAIKSYSSDPKKEQYNVLTPSADGKIEKDDDVILVTYKDTPGATASNEQWKKDCEGKQPLTNTCINLERKRDEPMQISVGGRNIQVFKKNDQTYYAALDTIQLTKEGLRSDYDPGAVMETDEDGRPYCIPTGKDGEYYRIYGYTKMGDPEPGKFDKWNVGPDGKLCSGDDKRIADELMMKDKVGEVTNLARKVGKCKEGGLVSIGTKNFKCSQLGHRIAQQAQQIHCQDVMDPSDCKMLFAVCDPVMCPKSRFNLGGKWPIEGTVVDTGIIGSLILGLPNFPETPLPVCLPGILAGLKSIKSLLQGFVECLHAAKINHENIGICDKIRSVGICELMWRELINIFKLRGSLADIISEKVFDKNKGSGGEYLSDFNQNLDAVSNSVNFFTKEYAESAFAAYKGRSTAEIGTDICKAAIYGKFGDIGDFVDQLAEPENPPQFFATFDEAPWAVTAGAAYTRYGGSYIQQSEYSVYYHLYAGSIPEFARTGYMREGIRYSVYLRGPEGILPVTTRTENEIWSTVPYDGYKDVTVERFGPTGMTQICVNINNREDCGFGKVTTNFATNYLNDKVIKDEVQRQIKTEQDCISEVPTLSPSLQGLWVSQQYAQYSVLPKEYGLLSTGVVRTCSVINPGKSTNEEDWKDIGSCGKDKQGNDLGRCWIDTRTTHLENLEKDEALQQFIIGKEQELKNKGIDVEKFLAGLYSPEEGRYYLSELDKLKESNKENQDELIKLLTGIDIQDKSGISYRSINEHSIETTSKTQAQIRVAEIYVLLAGTIGKPAKKPAEIVPTKFEIGTSCVMDNQCESNYCDTETLLCVEKIEKPVDITKLEQIIKVTYTTGPLLDRKEQAFEYIWTSSKGWESKDAKFIELVNKGSYNSGLNYIKEECEKGIVSCELSFVIKDREFKISESDLNAISLYKIYSSVFGMPKQPVQPTKLCSDCGKEWYGSTLLGYFKPCTNDECIKIPSCFYNPNERVCEICPSDCKLYTDIACGSCEEICKWENNKCIKK